MKKYIFLVIAGLFSLSVMAQQITGVVKDRQGMPVCGASVSVVGNSAQKTVTDEKGTFVLKVEKGGYIEVNHADRLKKRVWVTSEVMNIDLDENCDSCIPSDLRSTFAISTLSGEELSKNSMTDVSNTLYGLLSGLAVKQNTGWEEGATLNLRGVAPLIVVDGVPRSLQYLNALEVESVSVLKDGAAAALWGTRGANGVVWITTKRGAYDSRKVGVDYNYGLGMPVNQPEFADSYTYALMKNEALYYDGLEAAYDADDLETFKNGSDRELYPNVDWQNEVLRDFTNTHRFDMTFRGGGKKLRYYSLIDYKNQTGLIQDRWANYSERYNAQMKRYDLSARMNLDIDITDHTRVMLSMLGLLRENKRPNTDENTIFATIFNTPSAVFPIKTATDQWGGDNVYFKNNPVAIIADKGYNTRNERLLQSDFRICQDLSLVTRGLNAELGISYDNTAVFQETGSKTYNYETVKSFYNPETLEYELLRQTYGDNSALSISNGGLADQFMRSIVEGKLFYDRAFGKHAVHAGFRYTQDAYVPKGRNRTMKRQSFISDACYNYANRYFVNAVVNRSGTSVLSDGDKFRTYPAVSAAWMVSNENFMRDSFIDILKLHASWGRSGRDNIGYDLDEYYWIEASGYMFRNPPAGFGGLIAGTLPITDLNIELADKYDVGLDVRMFDRLSLSADLFLDKHKNELIPTTELYSSVIGTELPKRNLGRKDYSGCDLSLMWRNNTGKYFNYYVGGTFSYVNTKIVENGEGFKPEKYLYKKGHRVGQVYGLEAIGYFSDEADIQNSPVQMFSAVRPGDIKYKDQNNDHRVDQNDVVAIGYSSSLPGISYGISLGFEYKGFGVDAVFHGVSQYSRMLNTSSVYWPLYNNDKNLSMWYVNDKVRWTEETKEIANVPRLTTQSNANNFRSSTQWLVDGSFFKLRNLNIYYTLPERWTKSIKMERCRLYVRGNNLFSLDHIKYLNCEDLTVNYPDLISLFFGINISF